MLHTCATQARTRSRFSAPLQEKRDRHERLNAEAHSKCARPFKICFKNWFDSFPAVSCHVFSLSCHVFSLSITMSVQKGKKEDETINKQTFVYVSSLYHLSRFFALHSALHTVAVAFCALKTSFHLFPGLLLCHFLFSRQLFSKLGQMSNLLVIESISDSSQRSVGDELCMNVVYKSEERKEARPTERATRRKRALTEEKVRPRRRDGKKEGRCAPEHHFHSFDELPA